MAGETPISQIEIDEAEAHEQADAEALARSLAPASLRRVIKPVTVATEAKAAPPAEIPPAA